MEPATALDADRTAPLLPEPFARWFAGRGWAPRAHQLELLAKAQAGRSVLLIAPTGGGKTLAGFLPTLVELHEAAARAAPSWSPPAATCAQSQGLHTLYISPLKALAVDIARNLEIPVKEMGLAVKLETRTGDTPASKRQRQRRYPPDILLTTPEQLALLLASADAPYLFGTLRRVVLDELHSLVTSKRGDLLSLGLARLFALAPQLTTVGLSATVAEPDDLCRFLVPQPPGGEARADLVDGASRRAAAGHHARHGRASALGRPFGAPRARRNLRADQDAQDHAGLRQHPQPGRIPVPGTVGRQRRQSRHRAASRLARRGAAPQGRGRHGRRQIARGGVHLVARSRRRLGRRRSGHQCRRAEGRLAHSCSGSAAPITGWTSPRRPCWCRPTASKCWNAAPPSTPSPRTRRTRRLCAPARSTCLAQHILGRAVGAPFLADELYDEVRAAAPYAALARADFDAAVDFVATGGYALKAYERFAKIRQGKDGRWRITHPRVAQRYRMNVGTIVEADMLKVRLVRSRASRRLHPARRPAARRGRGIFHRDADARRHLRVRRRNPANTRRWSRTKSMSRARARPIRKCRPTKAASFRSRPISPRACARSSPTAAPGARCRTKCANGWKFKQWRSLLPRAGDLLVETFPRAAKYYLVCYPFEGRLAHQTLGMLLTRRLERARHEAARLCRQ